MLTKRQLLRESRSALYRALIPYWSGTRDALRKKIREFSKRYRRQSNYLLRLAREAALATLVAGLLLAGRTQPAHAIELSAIAVGNGGFIMKGTDAFDRSGIHVSSAGDVNGDGLEDIIIGTQLTSIIGEHTGDSFVVFGKQDGAIVELSDIVSGMGGFLIDVTDPENYTGVGVSAAGDVNGDGLDDLIIGAPNADANGEDSGVSYVIFGKRDGAAVEISDVASDIGDFVIIGIAAGDHSGRSVSSAGDVNGDGLADLIIGAFNADPNGDESGESYVVFGKTIDTIVELSDVASGIGGFVINGIDPSDWAGIGVSSAGDVNGDGLADLIIGASNADSPGEKSGESYVVFGKADGAAIELSNVAAGNGGYIIKGIDAGDISGFSVSAAGDVNGDGLSDVVISAYLASPGLQRTQAGECYVVFGKTNGTPVELRNLASGNSGFVMIGINSTDIVGRGVSSAGDVNGDGLADVILGADFADPNGLSSGQSYVVFGKTNSTLVDLSNIVSGVGGFALNGVESGDNSGGFGVSTAGDVNGDGLADLVVGARAASAHGSQSGESYVIFSPESAPPAATYLAKSRAGDGPGGTIVPRVNVGDFDQASFGSARCMIDFSDDDFGSNGRGGASLETVMLARSKAGISNLNPVGGVADVLWEIGSNRTGWDSATITLKYLDRETSGMPGNEFSLKIFNATALSGPWTELASTVDAAKNRVSANTAQLGFFAIGATAILNPEIDVTQVELDFGIQNIEDGPTAALTMTIENTGGDPLSFSMISIIGANPDDFGFITPPVTSELAAGTSRVLELYFDPADTGFRNAILQIRSNDADESNLEVPLSGEGFVTITALEVREHLLGINPLVAQKLSAADVNGDMQVDVADLMLLIGNP